MGVGEGVTTWKAKFLKMSWWLEMKLITGIISNRLKINTKMIPSILSDFNGINLLCEFLMIFMAYLFKLNASKFLINIRINTKIKY